MPIDNAITLRGYLEIIPPVIYVWDKHKKKKPQVNEYTKSEKEKQHDHSLSPSLPLSLSLSLVKNIYRLEAKKTKWRTKKYQRILYWCG